MVCRVRDVGVRRWLAGQALTLSALDPRAFHAVVVFAGSGARRFRSRRAARAPARTPKIRRAKGLRAFSDAAAQRRTACRVRARAVKFCRGVCARGWAGGDALSAAAARLGDSLCARAPPPSARRERGRRRPRGSGRPDPISPRRATRPAGACSVLRCVCEVTLFVGVRACVSALGAARKRRAQPQAACGRRCAAC